MRLERPDLRVCLVTALMVCPVALLAEWNVVEPFSRRIDVLLTTAATLSQAARQSMVNEAMAIWHQQGVDIHWTSPDRDRPVTSNRLRALVVQKRLMGTMSDGLAVGELVRPPSGHAVALISIENARHLVASVRGRAGYELITVDERRLGIVLGRALAHEVGHYLLNTHTHARSGLMRPSFDAFEFIDPRDGTFELDHDAAAWLRTRSAEKFAYAHR